MLGIYHLRNAFMFSSNTSTAVVLGFSDFSKLFGNQVSLIFNLESSRKKEPRRFFLRVPHAEMCVSFGSWTCSFAARFGYTECQCFQPHNNTFGLLPLDPQLPLLGKSCHPLIQWKTAIVWPCQCKLWPLKHTLVSPLPALRPRASDQKEQHTCDTMHQRIHLFKKRVLLVQKGKVKPWNGIEIHLFHLSG